MAAAAAGALAQYYIGPMGAYRNTRYATRRPQKRGYRRSGVTARTKRRPYTARMGEPVSKGELISMLNRRTGGFVGKELKFLTMSQSVNLSTTASGAGIEVDPDSLLCFNSMIQGTGPDERIGRHIWMKSLYIVGQVGYIPDEDLNIPIIDHIYTIWIVLDTQTNKAQLNSEDVLECPVADASMGPMCIRNMENTDRFTVLKKKTLRGVADTTAVATDDYQNAGRRLPFKFFLNLKNLKVLFDPDSTNGTIAQIMDNSIHMLATCSDPSAAPFIEYHARLRFYT